MRHYFLDMTLAYRYLKTLARRNCLLANRPKQQHQKRQNHALQPANRQKNQRPLPHNLGTQNPQHPAIPPQPMPLRRTPPHHRPQKTRRHCRKRKNRHHRRWIYPRPSLACHSREREPQPGKTQTTPSLSGKTLPLSRSLRKMANHSRQPTKRHRIHHPRKTSHPCRPNPRPRPRRLPP